jgi:DNA polymerase-3 subunit epsilon
MSAAAMPDSLRAALACLAQHPDYRVLVRLDPDSAGGPALTVGSIRRAAIIDTETTGMSPSSDQIIELGIVVFEYALESGRVGPVVGRLSALEDPGRPIPPESTAIHGITDNMVKGHRFDEGAVAALLDEVSLIVAHNAAFDRPFLEARFPWCKDLRWGCSFKDIPWREAGHGSSALEFLAYRAGFFYDGHRAEMDCLALLAVLARPFGAARESGFKTLLECARQPSLLLYALGSPFDSKDALKARGYRWHAERKVWMLRLAEADLAAEQAWLKARVYGGRSVELELETLDAQVRYSGREGRRRKLRI